MIFEGSPCSELSIRTSTMSLISPILSDSMLERLIMNKSNNGKIKGYCSYRALISYEDQFKLVESKQLLQKIINEKLPIGDKSLITISIDELYFCDNINVSYTILKY